MKYYAYSRAAQIETLRGLESHGHTIPDMYLDLLSAVPGLLSRESRCATLREPAGSGDAPDGGALDTKAFLASSIVEMSRMKSDHDPDRTIDVCGVLLGKFESTGKLFTSYSTDSWKGLGGYSDISGYALFACSLALLYLRHGGIWRLNALLKLNDMLVDAAARGLCQEEAPLVIASAIMELAFVEELYAACGFRMPVNK